MSIYVLRSDNLVKIGFSEHLRNRVGAIISVVPLPVEFVGYMPGNRDVEKHLHEKFATSRFSGEWFVETPAMRVVFEALLTPHMPVITPREKVQKRTSGELAALSEELRKAAALRWPLLPHGKRIKEVAAGVGWNPQRVKDFYYADKRVAVRAFEKEELALWLAPELKGEA